MDACDTLDLLALDPELSDRVAFSRRLAARPARTAAPRHPIHPDISARLATRGINGLWTHQSAAIDELRTGGHVVLATGTASGKSLCYQLPIVEGALNGSTDTALLIFPTKALAQDQLRALQSWLVPGVRAATYDGDTPTDTPCRHAKHANVVLTNPEMLHVGILPAHERWATFFMRLRYVVVDELHMLRGVFGSHVAHVLRRLRRVCAHYGSQPVVLLHERDDRQPGTARVGALRTRRHRDRQRWRTTSRTRLRLLATAVARRGDWYPTFGQCRDRRCVGSLRRARGIRVLHSPAAAKVWSWWPPRHALRLLTVRTRRVPRSRRTEPATSPANGARSKPTLATGELAGVVATSALELGIDVGGLDAVVCNGFPGTLASLWQQVGRAGRGDRRSAAVLVAGDDQLDQWYARHPDELFGRRPEAAVVNADEPVRRETPCGLRRP